MLRSVPAALVTALLVGCAAACPAVKPAADAGTKPAPLPPGARDWSQAPAVVNVDETPARLFAVSDVHGGFDRLVALLAASGLVEPSPPSPDAIAWTGGDATLVVVGDLFDKGPQGLEVIEGLMALEASAAAHGGRVVVTLGNHEAEFLADPSNPKAARDNGIDAELQSDGLPLATLSGVDDARGRWLHALPFAARFGRYFFAHAGNTAGQTVAELEHTLETAVDGDGYASVDVIGTDSILESREWYVADASVAPRFAAAAGAAHIVFGHDPSALGKKGDIGLTADGVLFRIDCGLSPDVDFSTGKLWRLTTDGVTDTVDEVDAAGHATLLWRGPAG